MPLPYEKTVDGGENIIFNLDHLIGTSKVVSVSGMIGDFTKMTLEEEIAALIQAGTGHKEFMVIGSIKP